MEKPQTLQRLKNEATINFIVNVPKTVPGGTKALPISYKRYGAEGKKEKGKKERKPKQSHHPMDPATSSWSASENSVVVLSVVVLGDLIVSKLTADPEQRDTHHIAKGRFCFL